MNITSEEVAQIVRRMQAQGLDVEAGQVESVYANFDDSAFRESELQRYEAMLWDRQSDINGVSASEVLEARDDIPEDGEVLLIKDSVESGQVVYFQPFVPGVEGFQKITDDNWQESADNLIGELVDRNLQTELTNNLMRAVKTGE